MTLTDEHKKRLAIALVCLLGLIVLILAMRNPPAPDQDETAPLPAADRVVVASVNQSFIYDADIQVSAQIRGLTTDGEALAPSNPEYARLRDELIDQTLLQQQALERELDQDKEVAFRLRTARARILADAMVAHHVEDALTDQALKDLYDAQNSLRQRGLETRALQILVPDQETAQTVMEKISAGDPFQTLVYAYSLDRASRENAGDMGYFTRDMFPARFSQPAFETAVGEIAGPFETSRGWHILKITDRRRAPDPSFEDMRPELERFITLEQIDSLLTGLKTTANISMQPLDGADDAEPPAGE